MIIGTLTYILSKYATKLFVFIHDRRNKEKFGMKH
jgi:hypothetical protein